MFYFPKDWVNLENKTQVLIVGSGAAGLSMALKLEKLNIPSLIIEGGELNYTEASQEIYKGEVVSDHKLAYDLDGSRQRFFGGSTNCWAGMCGELDEEGFFPRDWVDRSGWPIVKKDLDDYYNEAALFLGIDRKKINNPQNFTNIPHLEGFEIRALSRFLNGSGLDVDFFTPHLKQSNLISVYLNANCIKINASSDDRSLIKSVTIRSFANHEKKVSSEYYILCCGGIENARLLLNSTESDSPAITNKNNIIGRYYSDHPIAPCATVIGPKRKVFKSNSHHNLNAGQPLVHFYKLPFEIQKKQKISNSAICFFEQEDELLDGVIAARNLLRAVKKNKLDEYDRSDIVKILNNPFNILKSYFQRQNRLQNSKNPTIESRIAMRFQLEQTPNRESRVYLGNKLDKFGMRKVKLNWVFNKIERKTADLLMGYAADALQIGNIGTLKMDQRLYSHSDRIPMDLRGGQHHCGTTRMAATSDLGVVDKNLKTFGTKNLFICGSSVFPTNGWVNPTFTIVALSFRLVDYISKKMV
jgi:choline dehydrogenase-like flavoprotein